MKSKGTATMPKFLVTMTMYETCIIEAEDENDAERIARYETDADDWDDQYTNEELIIENYEGDRPAFNEERVET
jgi:hypothetical protein